MTLTHLVRSLWQDQSGATLSAELILITTILGIGSITGLTTIRDQVTFELADLATAFGSIDQSFSIGAITGTTAGATFSLAGSVFTDTTDFCFDTTSGGSAADAGTACVSLVAGNGEG